MRAISLSCPHCGAKLEAPETAHKVACTYCGTQSRIQHRTRYLERKVELPPPPPQERHMPVAKQKHGVRWIVGISSLLPMATAGAITYFTLQQTGGLSRIGEAISHATTVAGNAVQGVSERWTYSGSGSVLFFDVNGDGAQDIIGTVRYVQQDDSYRIAAFDGLRGDRLWESEVFGNHSDATEGQTGLHGEYVVQSDSRGNISGYSASTGGTLWKVSMGEKLREMCAQDEGHLALGLRDKRWKSLQLLDGSFSPLDGRPEGCARVSVNEERGQSSQHFASDERRRRPPKVKVDGMRVDDSLQLANEEGRFLLLGHKTPGTRIPMLALVHDSELDSSGDSGAASGAKKRKKNKKSKLLVDWASELPALDPLNVKEGAPELVAMNANFIAAIYTPKQGSPHLVCFSREGGMRLWDTPLPDNTTHVLRALDMSKARIYVSQWGRLEAFDAGSGALAFSLGR